MTTLIWKLLMWLWTRKAKSSYSGPGEKGELFNTACFQNAVKQTTGIDCVSQQASRWLHTAGYWEDNHHWFK